MVIRKCLPTLGDRGEPTARRSCRPRVRAVAFARCAPECPSGLARSHRAVHLACACVLRRGRVLADDEAFARELWLSISARSRSSNNESCNGPPSAAGWWIDGALIYQRGDPVEPGRLEVAFDASLGDHPAVTDHDDTFEPEALFELDDLIAKWRRHLSDGTLALYDVSSSYVEGRCCELARSSLALTAPNPNVTPREWMAFVSSSARAVASFAAGSLSRATISARAKFRSRSGP